MAKIKKIVTETEEIIPSKVNESTEFERELSEDELINDAINTELNDKFQAWIDEAREQSIEYNCYVYKFQNPVSGNEKEMAGKWVDQIPDKHEIGMILGGGRYQIIIQRPGDASRGIKQSVKGFRFKIHERYNKLCTGASPTPAGIAPTVPAVHPGNNVVVQPASMAGMVEVIKQVADILKPLIPQQQTSNIPDLSPLIIQNYKMMSAMMNSLLVEKRNLINNLDQDTGGDEIEAQNQNGMMNTLQSLLPLVGKIAPLLRGRDKTLDAILDMFIMPGAAPIEGQA